jgi:uncharacterized protein (UPF0303 family)
MVNGIFLPLCVPFGFEFPEQGPSLEAPRSSYDCCDAGRLIWMGVREDMERVALQELELALPRFDMQTAWELGSRLREMAAGRGLPVVIDVRRFGQPLFYTALAGTTPDNVDWVRRKSNLVARFHCSSYAISLKLKAAGQSLQEKYGLPDADYAAHGGSFPIAVVGAGVIGSVTVSGLPQRADHELAVEALCGLLAKDYAALRLDAEG